MNRQSLYFLAPGVVDVREELIAEPGSGQVLVKTLLSAISSGTEMLIYHGQFPNDLTLDENIETLSGPAAYPLLYGYSTVGVVVAHGAQVNPEWIGKRVFSFQPHVSHFVSETSSLQVVPEELTVEQAVFLPNMETALNLVMDGSPIIGERVVVLGQGVVGLLTSALLAQFPLSSLVTIDHFPIRRQASLKFGAQASFDPSEMKEGKGSPQQLAAKGLGGSDLVYELSGNPNGLNQAIKLCGFNGRIVIGSWYGNKRAELDLGGWFHRSRVKLISSQVSSINPKFSGRWDKSRRFQTAWQMVKQVQPAQLITHTFPIHQAGEAYRLLDDKPGETIQVVFNY